MPSPKKTANTRRKSARGQGKKFDEFVEKIIVHERDRKGSADTTQKIAVYFNFIGEYIPPAMAEKEPTPEELEEIRKREARKDKLHQNYLKRKANSFPKLFISYRKPRKLSEEQREPARERMRKINSYDT